MVASKAKWCFSLVPRVSLFPVPWSVLRTDTSHHSQVKNRFVSLAGKVEKESNTDLSLASGWVTGSE